MVYSGKKKVEKRGCKYHTNSAKLTKTEEEILHLLTDEFLTVKQISIRRQTSLEAIYKVRRKLKKKGYLGSGINKVEKVEPTMQPNDIRLHAQEFNIKILFQDHRYQKSIEKSNLLFLDSNTIRLYKNSIEIYSGNSFTGKSHQEADKKSLDYWKKLFIRLENDLGITLIKNRTRNIKEINHHFARGDSEICDNSIENKTKIRVFASEDGKLAFITDDSFGFREDETVHPITAKPDRKAIDKQVNDWRINNPPTNSELSINLNKGFELMNGIQQNQLIFAKNMESHIEAIKTLSKEVKRLSKVFKSTIKENKKLKLGNQKELKDFFK